MTNGNNTSLRAMLLLIHSWRKMEARETNTSKSSTTLGFRGGGRDEMNLAEFPLGVLADRTAPGQKTLVFEDRVHDAARNDWITRRLTISASEKYGLPTSLDDEVILGLIQLTKEQQFADRQVRFTRYHLREVLGWRDEGRSYQRIDTSLRRWLGVTLYYDKAWWDKASNSWVDENFHILDQVTIRRRVKSAHRSEPGAAISSFVWNDVVFRSFQAGYLKRLDWQTFRSLTLPTARRMYRFLDKRFYHKDAWEFDLNEFAFEHIGLSRSYDTGQVKRKLLPGLSELERVEFLEPLEPERRFVRVQRGDWRIVVRRQRTVSDKPVADVVPSEAVQALVARGVAEFVATELCKEYGDPRVEQQMLAFDRLVRAGKHQALRNPAGFLVTAIRQGYALGATPIGRSRREGAREASQPARMPSAQERENALLEQQLQKLSPAARQTLEQEALTATSKLLRSRYEEAISKGQDVLVKLYLEAILVAHLRKQAGAESCAVA